METIVALASAPMKSALSIIRLSGDDCFNVVSKVFSKDLTNTKKRDIHFGLINDGYKDIDQVVLLTYVAPHSFTGENSVEIMCHGSMLIVNQIITALIQNGARMAVNGEFSSRAYLNGKIDLIQAEGINDMINATSEEAKDMSMYALTGETSKIFLPIRKNIGELLSKIEVNIDYPEYEDIEDISKSEVIRVCSKIKADLKDLIESGEKNRIYHDGVKVAIVGKPNVGKSSLLNALIHEDKAIVTEIAGTTRDVVEGRFNLNGVPVYLYDTAGLHESEDKIEQIGINKAKEVINKADLILFVIDDTGIDADLFNLIKDKKHLLVYNKADILKVKDGHNIYVSAIQGDVKPLLDGMVQMLELDGISVKPSFTNTRQLGLLKNIVNHIELAIKDAQADEPTDLISASLMIAYNYSLDLLGESNKNDLTDEIFSRFCVGK